MLQISENIYKYSISDVFAKNNAHFPRVIFQNPRAQTPRMKTPDVQGVPQIIPQTLIDGTTEFAFGHLNFNEFHFFEILIRDPFTEAFDIDASKKMIFCGNISDTFWNVLYDDATKIREAIYSLISSSCSNTHKRARRHRLVVLNPRFSDRWVMRSRCRLICAKSTWLIIK